MNVIDSPGAIEVLEAEKSATGATEGGAEVVKPCAEQEVASPAELLGITCH